MSVKVKKQKKQRTTDLFAPSNAVNNVRVRSFFRGSNKKSKDTVFRGFEARRKVDG